MPYLTRYGFVFKEENMETRVAVMGIVVENTNSIEVLNALLHEYGSYIIGRMGIPYREKNINIISIAIDAPQDTISTLAGRIGKLEVDFIVRDIIRRYWSKNSLFQ